MKLNGDVIRKLRIEDKGGGGEEGRGGGVGEGGGKGGVGGEKKKSSYQKRK